MSGSFLELLRDPNAYELPRPLPDPIVTPRCVVRRVRRGDGPKYFAAVEASREALLPWMAWAFSDHQHVDDSVHYVERFRRAADESDCNDFPMAITDPSGEKIIGGTGLHDFRREWRQAEVGYWVAESERGTGLCTHAVRALIDSALRSQEEGGWGLRRLVVYNTVENIASRRVCEKLGLRHEGRRVEERYLSPEIGGGGYHDVNAYAVLADEWSARGPVGRRDSP